MKSLSIRIVLGAVFVSLFSLQIVGYCQEDKAGSGGVSKYGVIQDVAEDREIVRIGGIYQPEGLDKYMKRHFDDLHSKVSGIEERITGGLDLKDFEANVKTRFDNIERKLEEIERQLANIKDGVGRLEKTAANQN